MHFLQQLVQVPSSQEVFEVTRVAAPISSVVVVV
jgi:hypothetical protein